jgi:hypothetical protein
MAIMLTHGAAEASDNADIAHQGRLVTRHLVLQAQGLSLLCKVLRGLLYLRCRCGSCLLGAPPELLVLLQPGDP